MEKSYEMLSVGQKFEILNKVLVEFKNTIPEFRGWDNVLFARFLYDCFPRKGLQYHQRK